MQLFIGNTIRGIIRRYNDTKIDELSSQIYTDPLTGLYNRRYVDVCLGKAEKGRPYCVAMLDIDDFKKVNDTLGHACGDEVLVFLASFLQKRLRKTDTVFRWGGEEFLVVLNNAELQTAYNVLEKVRAELEKTPVHTKQGEVYITVTMGVTVLDMSAPYRSIEISDDNMYEGKRSTKNTVIYK